MAAPHLIRVEEKIPPLPAALPVHSRFFDRHHPVVQQGELRVDIAGVADGLRCLDDHVEHHRIAPVGIERDTEHGAFRYLIEVVTDPWSNRYTPYISSRVRALEIDTYYDRSVAGQPTLAPGMVLPTLTPPPVDMAPPGTVHRSELPNLEIRYETIAVNSGIPDSHFEFVPPEGSSPRCIPKYVNYVEPPGIDPSVPLSEPLLGRVRYSLNETDSGRVVTLVRGEIIEITLRIIPSLAFRWLMPAEGSGLELLNAEAFSVLPDDLDLNSSGALVYFKSNGYYRWRFLAKDPGITIFDGIFSLDGCDIGGAKRFNLTVQVIDNTSPAL
ncbi:MAG: hypothetical protein A4E40_00056 [Methanoregulaceae archaeon PtaU1.Bin059]|nr:MAG: hypothetical protein A4E40_00056 [Methanoregulaceae archaeon PtaU1.Bin059]